MINNLESFLNYLLDWFKFFLRAVRTKFMSRKELETRLLAAESQLVLYHNDILNKKRNKPLPTLMFRQLWVHLSKTWSNWQDKLIVVKPATVLKWHKTWFNSFWRRKSKPGRPCISLKTIFLIKRLHKENPLWSPERIHEQLIALNIIDAPAPNTIAKYFPQIRKPPTEKQLQSWRIFLTNHRADIWAMDLLTFHTMLFNILFVFIIISHDRRKIEHFAVTAHPTSAWVAQQLREATPFGKQPKYLIHDNDSIFIGSEVQQFLANAKIISKRTSFHSPWQNGVCERVFGTLRRELLNHIIPFHEKHLYHLLSEYINRYYNTHRTHQGINRQTPLPTKELPKTTITETTLIAEPILGGLYHNYQKVA